ncbi:alpha/beta hydrolase family protein [Shewanella sp. 10N.286.45.A1]|uniref:alpha/beta hydrolase family protein n=1 Tax=Shewanella sp. 10N.286.45.A1 TaxID=3229694 RepID=UPI003553B0DD
MRLTILLLLLAISPLYAQAQDLINHADIKNQKDCFSSIFKDYQSWRSAMKVKFSKPIQSEVQLSRKLTQFDLMFGEELFDLYKSEIDCRTFQYKVNGLFVSGYLMKPKTAPNKLPVLIYNRGGNGRFGSVVFGSMMRNLFPIAQQGFVIIGSQYRGLHNESTMFQDEFGGLDVDDVVALFDYIPNIEGADAKRIGMYGASRGGMQTHLAIKKNNNVKAIATIAGNVDLVKDLGYRPNMEKVYRNRIINYQENKALELKKRSVITWADKLSKEIPILLIHGSNDKRVSVKHSIALAEALKTNNVPHKLVIYPEDDHFLSINKKQSEQELVSWFKTYL